LYWEWVEPGGLSRSVAIMHAIGDDGQVRGSIGLAHEAHWDYYAALRTLSGRSVIVGYARTTTEAMDLLCDALAA